jgi:hypothetical protein
MNPHDIPSIEELRERFPSINRPADTQKPIWEDGVRASIEWFGCDACMFLVMVLSLVIAFAFSI